MTLKMSYDLAADGLVDVQGGRWEPEFSGSHTKGGQVSLQEPDGAVAPKAQKGGGGSGLQRGFQQGDALGT